MWLQMSSAVKHRIGAASVVSARSDSYSTTWAARRGAESTGSQYSRSLVTSEYSADRSTVTNSTSSRCTTCSSYAS